MDLTDFIEEAKPVHADVPFPTIESLIDKIRQRRAQMLIHSCIYYELNDNIISDHKWQQWADELEAIQNAWPELLKIGFYDYNFRDWDGATGNHLPHRDPWVFAKANYILELARKQ